MDHDQKLEQTAGIDGEKILMFFKCGHLPEKLRKVSEQFAELALHVAIDLPRCAELTVALRKLLEGKDAAVRAAL